MRWPAAIAPFTFTTEIVPTTRHSAYSTSTIASSIVNGATRVNQRRRDARAAIPAVPTTAPASTAMFHGIHPRLTRRPPPARRRARRDRATGRRCAANAASAAHGSSSTQSGSSRGVGGRPVRSAPAGSPLRTASHDASGRRRDRPAARMFDHRAARDEAPPDAGDRPGDLGQPARRARDCSAARRAEARAPSRAGLAVAPGQVIGAHEPVEHRRNRAHRLTGHAGDRGPSRRGCCAAPRSSRRRSSARASTGSRSASPPRSGSPYGPRSAQQAVRARELHRQSP